MAAADRIIQGPAPGAAEFTCSQQVHDALQAVDGTCGGWSAGALHTFDPRACSRGRV